MQHAHQKGIIHRDLKPTNVMVTLHDGAPVPKIIDFGVAKALNQRLTDDTIYTRVAQFLGTPMYMSPEQAELSGLDVDTRCDVYSLGVLLYELLTGHTPFDKDTLATIGFEQLCRMIREDEPPRPSARISTLGEANRSTVANRRGIDDRSLARALRGELDWIVMKALEKDRARRYSSVEALADDLQRFLDSEPVQACPPSVAYRVRKWLRRYRLAATVAFLVAFAVITSSVLSAYQYLAERAARHEADEQRALAVANAAQADRHAAAETEQRQAAQRERDVALLNLYYSDVRGGLADWQSGNISRLSEKLLRHVPQSGQQDRRGWEWYYLVTLCHDGHKSLMEHRRAVHSVASSPTGNYYGSTGHDEMAAVYDAATGTLLRTWRTASARGASWSPDGRQFAWGTVADDCGVYVADVASGELRRFTGHFSSVWATTWSPDNHYLASAGMDRTIRIFDLQTGLCIHEIAGFPKSIESLAWHPTGKLLACGDQDESISIWEPFSGECLHMMHAIGDVNSVSWSRDGERLAAGTGAGTWSVYDVTDWTLLHQSPLLPGEVEDVAFTNDGTRLATCGGDALIRVYSTQSWESVEVMRGHRGKVNSVSWSSDDRNLISGSHDGLVKIWRSPPPAQPATQVVHRSPVLSIGWEPDSDRLRSIATEDPAIREWRMAAGESKIGEIQPAQAASFNADLTRLAVITRSDDATAAQIFESRSSNVIQTIAAPTANLRAIALSPDCTKLALTGDDLVVMGVNSATVCWRRPRLSVGQLSWSPDGKQLAVAGSGEINDGGDLRHAAWIYVFAADTGEDVLKEQHGTFRNGGATSIAWSPDGQRIASGDKNGLVEIRDPATRRWIAAAQLRMGAINDLHWSHDGTRLAAAGADGAVTVIDPATGEALLALELREGSPLCCVRWSPDGLRLAAADTGGVLHVWNAIGGREFVQSEEYAALTQHHLLSRAARSWQAGDRQQALSAIRQVIEGRQHTGIEPWIPMEMENRARACAVSGQTEVAVGLARAVTQVAPDRAHDMRGLMITALTRAGRADEALTIYEHAKLSSPADPVAADQLAWYLVFEAPPDQWDPLTAITLAQEGLVQDPKSAALWSTLGLAQYRAEGFQTAIESVQKSIDLSGGRAWDFFIMAMCHWRLGAPDRANDCYSRGVAMIRADGDEDLRSEAAELLGIRPSNPGANH